MRKQVRLRPSTFKKLLFVFLLSARLPVCFRTPFDVLTKQRKQHKKQEPMSSMSQ